MSPPIESEKNASPARQKIATNHGSTSTSVHIRPQTGRSRHSHAAERSRIAERHDRQPDEHQDQRPLEQDAAGERRPEDRGRTTTADAPDPRRAARTDRPAPAPPSRRRRSSSSIASVLASRASAPSSTELHIISAASDRAAPRHEGERRPVGQEHRADGADQRRNAVEPDAQLRAAAGRAPRRFRPPRPAASRCRPASCSGRRPGSGCRRNRRSRPSAWSPARTAPRRGRSAGC